MTTDNLISFTESPPSKITKFLGEQGNKKSYLKISLTMTEGGGAGYEFGLEDSPTAKILYRVSGVRA